jgi:hypothetical protein
MFISAIGEKDYRVHCLNHKFAHFLVKGKIVDELAVV